MTPLFLLLACNPSDPGTAGDGAATDVTTDTEVPEVPPPLGFPALDPQTMSVRVDSAFVTCEGDEGRVRVETSGMAETVELDIVHGGEVHTVALTDAERPENAVWFGFEGNVACNVGEDGTWLIRAFRDGEEQDCAAGHPGRAEMLAGAHDELLAAAGRPTVAGCHDLAD